MTSPRLVFLAVVWLGLAGCRDRESTAEAAENRSFPVATPVIKDIVVRHDYVAQIEAVRHAELHTRIKGTVESVDVDEGAKVKKGQLLFSIDARVRKQDVAVARAATQAEEAELHAAELDVQNTQLLADKNIVSAAELQRAQSRAQMLRAKVQEAKAVAQRASVELDRADIRAPFDGVIDRIPNKAGTTVAEDTLLTTISDSSEVFAYFSISEREYLMLVRSAPGAQPRQVSLVLADGSPFGHQGYVDAVASELDPKTGTLAYRARFPNPERTLKHGSSGKVVIETALAAAVLVPQSATFEVQGNVYVYIVDASNVVHVREVEVAERLEDSFAIRSGLTVKDRFVVEGLQLVKDGMTIEPRTPDSRS
ncbi:MAG: efflux RND transporter periplasmic adaptor subunit [Acidobacteriota bacterium]